MDQDASTLRQQKVALIVGFVALTAALLRAYAAPATGYELSIYGATPTGYWIGVAVATAVALWVAAGGHGRVRDAAHLLATGAVVSVLALPVLRSYEFYGSGDALTHLGWAREMGNGELNPLNNLYPGIHLVANYVNELAGLDVSRALMLLPVVVFPLVFAVFVSLSVAAISESPRAATIGLFSALLIVPLNLVSNHPVPHPSTQGILFVPLVLYLIFRYVEAPEGLGAFTTPSGAAVAISGVALVFYHPQEAMNLLALLVAIAAVQLFVQQRSPEHSIADHRPIYGHVILVGVTFFVWTFRHQRARDRLSFVVDSLITSGATTLEQTGSRASSLQALGGSVEEIVLKLFGVTVVFGLLAMAVLLPAATGRLRRSTRANASLVTYLGAGLIPLGTLFVIIFLANQGDHYFRFFGFMLVPITILGAVAICLLVDRSGDDVDARKVVAVVVLAFALMIPVQALAFHHSPYMYQSNQQVSEGNLEGHANAFEYRDESITFMGIRAGPMRYVDATYGSSTAHDELNFPGYRNEVPSEVFNENLSTAYPDDRYLTTHDGDYQREIGLYEGFRYSEEGFERLESEPGISRVQSNGDFQLYLVEGTAN